MCNRHHSSTGRFCSGPAAAVAGCPQHRQRPATAGGLVPVARVPFQLRLPALANGLEDVALRPSRAHLLRPIDVPGDVGNDLSPCLKLRLFIHLLSKSYRLEVEHESWGSSHFACRAHDLFLFLLILRVNLEIILKVGQNYSNDGLDKELQIGEAEK